MSETRFINRGETFSIVLFSTLANGSTSLENFRIEGAVYTTKGELLQSLNCTVLSEVNGIVNLYWFETEYWPLDTIEVRIWAVSDNKKINYVDKNGCNIPNLLYRCI